MRDSLCNEISNNCDKSVLVIHISIVDIFLLLKIASMQENVTKTDENRAKAYNKYFFSHFVFTILSQSWSKHVK